MLAQIDLSIRRPGWLTFAAVVVISTGVLRVITAIYYFAGSSRINDLRGGAFGQHLFLWGLWDLVIAVLAIAVGALLLKGDELGRAGAAIWAVFVIIESFLILRLASWFGAAAMLLAILVLYAISVSPGYSANDPLNGHDSVRP